MRHVVVAGSVLALSAQAFAADCAEWNTAEFFESATLEEVVGCLVAGAEVSARDESSNTLLHTAAALNENPLVVVALVASGAGVNARDKYGRTPLHDAAAFNDNHLVGGALVLHGADVNARDGSGATPLHRAAWSTTNDSFIWVLLGAGADAATRDNYGLTAWDYAQDNEALSDTGAWWRLHDGRFE